MELIVNKSIFNWVGNKWKYRQYIERYAVNFDIIVDPMMGSGNILTYLGKTKNIIGNDIIPLMPNIYNNKNVFDVSIQVFKDIIDKWSFTDKKHYYEFREYWNKKYINNNYDKKFLVETFLLLKMCSNSMVRFNNKGRFNQGFRGIGGDTKKSFFSYKQLENFSTCLEEWVNISYKTAYFFNMDVLDFLNKFINKDMSKTIFIFDPPYLLESGVYNINSYTNKKEKSIFNFIIDNNINFIFFNFLSKNKCTHLKFKDFIENNKLDIITLKEKTATGQNRHGTSNIREVLITNLKN